MTQLILFLSCVWLIQSGAQALDFKCTGEVSRHPNYDRCNRFYLCQNRKVFLDNCPPNLRFDSLSLVCVEKSKAVCATRPTTESSVTGTTKQEFRCSVKDGNFVHEENCEDYYQCFNFLVYDKTCPGGTLFDEQAQQCIEDAKVDCGNRFRPAGVSTTLEPTNETITEQETEEATEASTEATTEPSTEPSTEQSTEASTEPSTEPSTEASTEPATVAGTTQKKTTPRPVTQTEDPGSWESFELECPEPDGIFPHPVDKRKYLICEGGFPNVMVCSANLIFDPEKKVCDW